MTIAGRGAASVVAAALLAGATLTAAGPETFTATASVKRGGASATAPIRVTVNSYASDADREAATRAVRSGGTAALRKLLVEKPDAGFIQVGDRRTAIKYAGQRDTAGGRLITAITAEPILHLGAGVPEAKATTGFDLAVAMFEVQPNGPGVGDLSPAAKVGLDDGGALVIEDYGATVVWLNNIAVEK